MARTLYTWSTAHVCTRAVYLPIRACGVTTSSVVPPQTRTGGRAEWVQMWAVLVGACVRMPSLILIVLDILHAPTAD